MISLVIKNRLIPGAVHQAQKRGIKLLSAKTLRKGEIVATAAETDLNAVTRWYCEQGEAPFAWGTLPFYQIQNSAKPYDKRPRDV